MKNRVLSILLALCFVVTLLPAAAFADSEPVSGKLGDNITWVFDNGTLTVSGNGEMEDCTWGAPWLELSDPITKVVITKGVTSVGAGAFYCCMGLKTVVLPEGIKTIDDYAFSNCTALESVTFPGSLKSIGFCAFLNCTSLKSITIPSGVTEIGYGPFFGCTGLESINAAAGNGTYSSVNGVLFNKDKTELIAYPAGKTDAAYAIPSGVITIEDSAFLAGKFKSVTIPGSVKLIGYGAFTECENLESVTIPNSVTNVADYAFSQCTALTTATMPNSVSKISYGTFCDCTSLKSVTIPVSVKSIDHKAFSMCTKLASVNYRGTSAQWKAVTVGEDNDALKNAKINCAANAPSAPALKITTVSGHPKIYWNSVDGAYKYWIYRSTDGKNFKYYDRTSKTSYTNNATNIGTLYYYKVKAVKAVDGKDIASAYSTKRSIRCKPAVPKLTLTRSAGKPKLSWNAVKGADKYWIYRSTDGKNFKYYDRTSKTSYTNNSTATAKRYWYKIKAVKVVNGKDIASAYSNSDFVWTTTKAPTLSITTYKGDPKITWKAVPDADLYWVFRSTDGEKFFHCKETKDTSYIDKNVKPGTKYYYKVQAVAHYNGTFAIPSAYSYPVSITAK